MVEQEEDSPMFDEGQNTAGHEADEEEDQSIGTRFILIDQTTGQRFESSQYVPLIHTAISGVKDVFKPIKNDKELEAEITRIALTLADDKTADWTKRVNDLQRLQFFAQTYAGVSEHGPAKFSASALVNGVNKLVPCLTAQILCLRSQVAKEAGSTIQMFAEALGDDFEPAAFRLLSKDSIVKLMHVGKSILAEIGTTTALGILHNLYSVKVIQRLAGEMQESKSSYVQKVAGMFLLEILSIYPKEIIISLHAVLKPFMKYCLQNSNGDCRNFGRKALLIWQQIDPPNSERIFHGIDQAIQRAILEDELKYQVHAVQGDEIQLKQHKNHSGGPQVSVNRVPSREGRLQGSPKPHALGSPKRIRPTASPKPGKGSGKLLDPNGARTVSRGKLRPGSAAAPGSNLRSIAQKTKQLAGETGARLGGILPTMEQASTGLGFFAQQSSGSDPASTQIKRTTQQKQSKPAAIDPLMGSIGSTNSTNAMKPPSSVGQNTSSKKTPIRSVGAVMKPTATTTTSFKYDFNPQKFESSTADVVMLTEKQQQQQVEFDFTDNYYQLNSTVINKRSKALEELMRQLVFMSKEEISIESQDPNSKFADTISLIQDRFLRREDHSSLKALELQIDAIQFLLNSIPETLIDQIGPICMSFVNCCVMKRNPKIQEKGYEVLDEIKRIFTEGVLLPHFINVYQCERSTEFTYILEAMSFMNSLVQASEDLCEAPQFEYITQTVGQHLENYLKYNRREKNELELFISSKKNGTKHMEVVSLGVLTSLTKKNELLTMKAIMELPPAQIDYIKQIADEYDEKFSIAMQAAIGASISSQPQAFATGTRTQRSPPLGSPRQSVQNGAAAKKQTFKQQPYAPLKQNMMMDVDEGNQNSALALQQEKEEQEKQDLRAKIMMGSQIKKERAGVLSPNQTKKQRLGIASPAQGQRSPGATRMASGRSSPRVSGKASPQKLSQSLGYQNNSNYIKAPHIIQKSSMQQSCAEQAPTKDLVQTCNLLNDQGVIATAKLAAIQFTHANLREILWINQLGKPIRVTQDNFEVFLDCLIYFILKNANLKQQSQPVSRLEEQSCQTMANASFDLLTAIVNMTPMTMTEFQTTNPNSPPSQTVDTSRYFDGESSNASPLTLRDKLVRSVLFTYTEDVPQQHQAFSNAKAEELLKAIAHNSQVSFLGTTVSDLCIELQPPRLQAVLRMSESRVRELSARIQKQTYQLTQEDLESLMHLAIHALAPQLNHTVPDVRKTVVFALVEVGEVIGLELFATEVMEKHLNISQQRLVQIYIERKQFQSAQR